MADGAQIEVAPKYPAPLFLFGHGVIPTNSFPDLTCLGPRICNDYYFHNYWTAAANHPVTSLHFPLLGYVTLADQENL